MNYAIRGIAACVAMHLLVVGPLQAASLAEFRLQVEDLNNNPVAAVNLGQDFQLAAYVADIRDPAAQFPGVWAAFMNVAYNGSLVSITATPNPNPNQGDGSGNFGDLGIKWGDYFKAGLRFGNLNTPGQINGIGSDSLKPVQSGLGEVLLWRITIHTAALGTATFSPAFDSNPDHESSLIEPPDALTDAQIQFIGDSVQIVPEPSGLLLAALGLFGLVVGRRRKRVVVNATVAISRRPRFRSAILTF